MGAALPVPGQETKSPPDIAAYKVEFHLRDGNDPAAKAGRRYTMLVNTTGKETFRVGNRVPVASGSSQPGLMNTQAHLGTGSAGRDCLMSWKS